jgi:hypothetical protein
MAPLFVHLLAGGTPPDGEGVVLAATVHDQLLGDAPRWTDVIVADRVLPDAGAEHRIVLSGHAMTLPTVPPDVEQRPWSAVEHPPTEDDGPVHVLHVLRFEHATDADATPEEMATYTRHAMSVAGRHGGGIAAWLAVDAVVEGDGRTWHQARFNTFPSRAAFMAVVFDPDRLEAQRNHREVAIAETYTLVLRPSVDRLQVAATTA